MSSKGARAKYLALWSIVFTSCHLDATENVTQSFMMLKMQRFTLFGAFAT